MYPEYTGTALLLYTNSDSVINQLGANEQKNL